MVYGINYLLGNTWQSVGFLVQVSHYGCFIFIFLLIKFFFFFCPFVLEVSLNDCTPVEVNPVCACVCVSVDTDRTLSLPVQRRGYCIFSSLLSLGVAILLTFYVYFKQTNKQTNTQQKCARNPQISPLSRCFPLNCCYISSIKPLAATPFLKI